VLVTLFPNQAPAFDALHGGILNDLNDGPQKRTRLAWGTSVATRILASRRNVGASATVAPPTGAGPGAWVLARQQPATSP
jgi:hypothetical protein